MDLLLVCLQLLFSQQFLLFLQSLFFLLLINHYLFIILLIVLISFLLLLFFLLLFSQSFFFFFLLLKFLNSWIIFIGKHDQFFNSFFFFFNHLHFQSSVLLHHVLLILSTLGIIQVILILMFEVSIRLKIEPKIIKLFYLFFGATKVSNSRHWLDFRPV